MGENDLFALVIAALGQGLLTVMPANKVPVIKQSYQPTQQGVEPGPAIYLNKTGSRRYGYPSSKGVYNPISKQMDVAQLQYMETTFQVNGWAIRDPANLSAYTPADLTNLASSVLQSEATRDLFSKSNVQVLRVTDIRNPYYSDDMDRFEPMPSFDLTVTHQLSILFTTPAVTSIGINIQPV